MKRMTKQDLLHFFRQLGTLISAGISLMKCLEILAQTSEKEDFRSLIKALRLDLESGREFNHCLRRYPRWFDLLTCQLICIGEQTGTLDKALLRIAQDQEKNLELKKQIKHALLYPAFLFCTALLTTLSLLLFVVPPFAALFEHFPNKIPLPTRALIQLAFHLKTSLPLFGLLFTCSLATLLYFRHSLRFADRCQHLLFRIAPLRKLALRFALVRFSRALATILAAGLSLTEALLLVAQLSPFDEFRRGILKIYTGVNAGNPLSSNLRLLPDAPALLIQMTQVGEESGTLDPLLEKFAEIAETALMQQLLTLRLLLEPLIIAILGVLIGGIVIALYLPIFRLGTAIS